MVGLAAVLHDRGGGSALDEAVSLCRAALAQRLKGCGELHPLTSAARRQLAGVCVDAALRASTPAAARGLVWEAEVALLSDAAATDGAAVSSSAAVGGGDGALSMLSALYQQQGRLVEALPLLRADLASLTADERAGSAGSVHEAHANLGRVLAAMGAPLEGGELTRRREAVTVSPRAHNTVPSVLALCTCPLASPRHVHALSSLYRICTVYVVAGDWDERRRAAD